jgi:deoxyribonuclease V
MPSVSHLIQSWKQEQLDRAGRVRIEPLRPLPRFVAGADCAFSPDGQTIFAVALVYDRKAGEVVEIVRERRSLTVPYIPGYLAFREGPALLAAIGRLGQPFGVICFDGHGMAHPRRCGIATYLGVELDVPTVGIAKSVLCGEFTDPPTDAGRHTRLIHRDETIGWALRTRPGVKPVFVSVGHRVDLATATRLAMACVTRYRLPEPTRQADRLVAIHKVEQLTR